MNVIELNVETFLRTKQGQRQSTSKIKVPAESSVICVVLPEDSSNIMSIEIEIYNYNIINEDE